MTDESLCKAIIDFLVKRAYGEHAKICISKDKIGCNVGLKIEDVVYYLLGYDGLEVKTSFEFYCEDFTWRNFLNQLKDFVQKPNAYVSYFVNKPHLIDHNTSIEEIIITLDLMPVE